MADDEIKLPLTEYTREVVRMAILEARQDVIELIRQHRQDCPVDAIAEKVGALQMRFATLVGLLTGAGVLGGTVGAGMAKLIGL